MDGIGQGRQKLYQEVAGRLTKELKQLVTAQTVSIKSKKVSYRLKLLNGAKGIARTALWMYRWYATKVGLMGAVQTMAGQYSGKTSKVNISLHISI